MNATAKSGVLIAASFFSALALAAGPTAGSASALGGATTSSASAKASRDIEAQKDNRLDKCAAMHGDEKKGCQENAKAIAETSRRAHGLPASAPKT